MKTQITKSREENQYTRKKYFQRQGSVTTHGHYTVRVIGLLLLTHFWPMLPFYTPENTSKLLSFWCFQGIQNKYIGQKRIKDRKENFLEQSITMHKK